MLDINLPLKQCGLHPHVTEVLSPDHLLQVEKILEDLPDGSVGKPVLKKSPDSDQWVRTGNSCFGSQTRLRV